MTNVARFEAMGCSIAVAGATSRGLRQIRALFDRYDATFSRFRMESELSRLNAAGGGEMSELFADVLGVARWAAVVTGGLVDPTVGAAVVAAGYDRDFAAGLDDARPAGRGVPGDYRSLRVAGRVLELEPGVQLDLNGVVKALAVDRAAALLSGEGFVSAGGDLMTRGAVDVGLSGGAALRVRGGLATSGTTRRWWVRGGAIQHHLIDPRTGVPARTHWVEATVCGTSCLHADVAAKAALLAGRGWLELRRLPGRLRDRAGDVFETYHWRSALATPVCI